jgi:hypothetical protein
VSSALLILVWHDGDIVNENLQLVMIEILDKFIVVVFEFLKAVIVIE